MVRTPQAARQSYNSGQQQQGSRGGMGNQWKQQVALDIAQERMRLRKRCYEASQKAIMSVIDIKSSFCVKLINTLVEVLNQRVYLIEKHIPDMDFLTELYNFNLKFINDVLPSMRNLLKDNTPHGESVEDTNATYRLLDEEMKNCEEMNNTIRNVIQARPADPIYTRSCARCQKPVLLDL
jgi:hypothetical protein